MTEDLRRAIKTYTQWFGSYKASGDLTKIQVWLTLNEGRIEFLTQAKSYKVRRARRNPRVICFVGSADGPAVHGTAEIVPDKSALWRVYRAYWKTHPLGMVFLGLFIGLQIASGSRVVVRVQPDEPNPLAGMTDPAA